MITIDCNDRESAKKVLFALLEKDRVLKGEIVYKNGYKESARIGKSSTGIIMVFNKNSKRYGRQLFGYFRSGNDINEIKISESKNVDPKDKWEKSWNKVLGYLNESGLWEDLAENIRVALEIGFDKITEANSIYWKDIDGLSYEENRELQQKKIKEIDPRLFNTEILWHISHAPKVKTMYFGKWYTESTREKLAEALKNKKDYRFSLTVGYDVSVHYNQELNKLWYSEEYRGCGNGHYYLGLDSTHALFYEDD